MLPKRNCSKSNRKKKQVTHTQRMKILSTRNFKNKPKVK